ncbi:hypothetical protein BGZ79_006045, partial [Entomortierella chlamydospora]
IENPKVPRRGPRLPAVDRMTKAEMVKALAWEHPFATLDIGTVAANVRSALKIKDVIKDPEVAVKDNEVAEGTIKCLRDIVKEANRTKRRCQQLLGTYIEQFKTKGLTPRDKNFFEHLCPSIPPKNTEGSDSSSILPVIDLNPDRDNDVGSGQTDKQVQFITCFMGYLYSNNFPRQVGVGGIVNDFIARLKEMGLHQPLRGQGEVNVKPEFSPTALLRSVSVQLAQELMK